MKDRGKIMVRKEKELEKKMMEEKRRRAVCTSEQTAQSQGSSGHCGEP